ncbi:MAG: toxin-antitoxin system HicB family antitoxin [Deltaproteobacteria bacterium]|nr:toxin-antitoxin system HicB family antitoxin [Deltaproteobacteria bacterium]
MRERDKYLKIVEWSEEDQCYVGTCPGLMIGGVHGKIEAKVYAELCKIVDEWIKIYKKDGVPLPKATANKDFSGKFVLRTGKSFHKALAIAALRQGESLNNFCLKILKTKIA